MTGTPVITYEVIALMKRAYTQGTIYAIVLVSAFAFAMLRRLRETSARACCLWPWASSGRGG